ncbi:hypothetical protein [Nocardia fusca]|uniref:hypothetical protein n=1 Tax=Nocardia fusca TaxID=941183 RepID=UPI0012F4B046|nr:hypothetical protein [Nocardia fusca]
MAPILPKSAALYPPEPDVAAVPYLAAHWGTDVGYTLTLLRLDDDLVLRDLVQAVEDPQLLAAIDAEFEAGLDWLEELCREPGHTPTVDDVIEVIQSIIDALPADLDLDTVAASAVDAYLEHAARIVCGIVVDAAPVEP